MGVLCNVVILRPSRFLRETGVLGQRPKEAGAKYFICMYLYCRPFSVWAKNLYLSVLSATEVLEHAFGKISSMYVGFMSDDGVIPERAETGWILHHFCMRNLVRRADLGSFLEVALLAPAPSSANEVLFGNGARNVRQHRKCDPSLCLITLIYYL